MNSDFTKSKRFYEAEGYNRFCKKQYFTHVHKTTNEKWLRKWLCYSGTKGNLYCFTCKLAASSNTELHIFCEGFNAWKNAQLLIETQVKFDALSWGPVPDQSLKRWRKN